MSDETNQSQSEEEYDAVLNDVLKTLRAEYKQDLPLRMEELQNSLTIANSDSKDALDHLKNAHVVAHRFAGTAGSYGFQNLSEAAQELDLYFKSLFQNSESNLDWQKISSLAERMHVCINESTDASDE
ncbi:MAG: Hpt domain-containing protein [Leptolyngbya sp.]|nr:Hpt domain-containing protein [Candidatus Melainabacteria bacterium]